MRYTIYFLIIDLVLGLVRPATSWPVAQADAATVVINELFWMGSSASSADEWVELRNTTDTPIDISHWSLTKKSSGQEVAMLELPANASIAAGGFFLISNYANTSSSTTLGSLAGFITTDVALSNSALQIKLYDTNHQLIDTADDGIGNPQAGLFDSAKHIYASAERNPIPGDGSLAQNWHSATRSVGFKATAIELGTPGSLNSNGFPVAKAGSDQKGLTGAPLNFDGSESIDPEGSPLTYHWDFGDGAVETVATPNHAFAAAGAYTVTLVVSDGTDVATDSVAVTITDAPAATSSTVEASPDESNVPTEVVATTSCLGLKLSEVYPNPPGVDQDEYIELVNASDEDVVMGSCAIASSATRQFHLPAGTLVARGAILNFSKTQTHLTLNNGGTTVRLLDSDGTELDRTIYTVAKEGSTWASVDGAWAWTIRPTPGEKNVQVTPLPPATRSTTTLTKTSTKAPTVKKPEVPAQRVGLPELQELDSGDRVLVEGVVTAPRDALGSTVAFLQTETGGVSITIPNGEPAITPGQTIEITGTVRLKNGRRYVAVSAKSLRVKATAPLPPPVTVQTDDVGADQADQLVHVKGVVGIASGNRIEIDDGSGPVPIYLKSSTGIVRPKVKPGDTVDAIGIVSVSTSGIRVLPRSQDDLHVERVLGVSTTAPMQTVTAPAASRNQTMWYWLMVAAGAVVATARPVWKKLSPKMKKTTD